MKALKQQLPFELPDIREYPLACPEGEERFFDSRSVCWMA